MSLVTLPNYDLTEDERVNWARQYGQLLPRLLPALVDAGLAKTHVIQTKEDTKMRVTGHLPVGLNSGRRTSGPRMPMQKFSEGA